MAGRSPRCQVARGPGSGSLAGVVLPAVCTDTEGIIEEATGSFSELVGGVTGEVVGRSLPTLFGVEDRRLVSRQLALVGDRPTGDLVARLHVAGRLVPCVVGVGAAGEAGSGSRAVWVVVRAATWADSEPWDVTIVAQELGALVAHSASLGASR